MLIAVLLITSIIGAAFYPVNPAGPHAFPQAWRGGLFLSAHGSWHQVNGRYVAPPRIAFVAMSYELIEWLYAAYGSNAAAGANFLGSQGDIWDAQKDMLMDTLGAIAAVLLFLAVRSGDGSSSKWSRPRA